MEHALIDCDCVRAFIWALSATRSSHRFTAPVLSESYLAPLFPSCDACKRLHSLYTATRLLCFHDWLRPVHAQLLLCSLRLLCDGAARLVLETAARCANRARRLFPQQRASYPSSFRRYGSALPSPSSTPASVPRSWARIALARRPGLTRSGVGRQATASWQTAALVPPFRPSLEPLGRIGFGSCVAAPRDLSERQGSQFEMQV